MSYFYLVASLPQLTLGESPPQSVEDFVFHCTGVLSDQDLRELTHLVHGEKELCSSGFASTWFGADTQLRNAAAKLRANRLSVESRSYMKPHAGFNAFIEKSVTDAYARSNPLEREMSLDRCRWKILDELASAEPFGLGVVLAFAVKLQIADRWAKMTNEEGYRRIEEFVDNIEVLK